ncbi:MAG: hypothetical protein EBS36_06220 [Actinobacteria bacterium]|nr:hypothetical protein [Actinomycetota bacterium]NBY15595.1 hypothetical protein [Actinomycetota bacterium]
MSEHQDHGHTVAAWTAVIIVILAFLVGTIGLILAKPSIFWVGAGLIPVGLIAGKVLALMGFGAKH